MTFDELAQKLMPELLDLTQLSPSCWDELCQDLYTVLQGSMTPDGYALARRFDDLGYWVDANFVATLHRHRDDIHAYMKESRGK